MEAHSGYDDRVYWIWLQKAFSWGSHRINAIVSHFESAREIYERTPRELRESRCFTPAEIDKMAGTQIGEALVVARRCDAIGCRVVTPQDAEYPERLRNIYAMPAVLYVMGDLTGIDNELAITMIGARKCSEYGLHAAKTLGRQLALSGATVVSGCAAGIDTASLEGAIAGHGRVVGVLGSGLDILYPASGARMMRWMAREQALLSEFPPGTKPMRQNFPIRNRILSALGVGTLVVEASKSSGSLITVNLALEQGKDVFAVPGRMDDPLAQGTLGLIRQGAKLVVTAEDILSEYQRLCPEQLRRILEASMAIEPAAETEPEEEAGPAPEKEPETAPEEEPLPEGLGEREGLLYRCLSDDPLPAQTLASRTGLTISQTLPALTELELLGLAEPCAGGRYRRTESAT